MEHDEIVAVMKYNASTPRNTLYSHTVVSNMIASNISSVCGIEIDSTTFLQYSTPPHYQHNHADNAKPRPYWPSFFTVDIELHMDAPSCEEATGRRVGCIPPTDE